MKEKEKDVSIYSTSEEWKDVTPLLQDDGPDPFAPISYTKKFKETMDYFRAILKLDEKSERALALTKDVIRQNAANYTAWYYRRLILLALNKDLKEEIEFCSEIARENQKNYQIWYHRQWCVEKCQYIKDEMEFTAEMIESDNKNYHVWSYRQFIVKTYNLWEEDLKFVDKMLRYDIRNNSAWNQRYFIITHYPGWNEKTHQSEADYAISMIQKAPNNSSPWIYLKGVVRLTTYAKLNLKNTLLEFKEKFSVCPHVYSTLLDLYEEENTLESLKEAVTYCENLAKSLDNIHYKFWDYKKSKIEERIKNLK
eukprot:TRINITY_DN2012_c0_g1_i1.p1 TRINITY_DN2012_c0_g1~~TRINITY_DN2012_c0_g1_i1.p1  ORF type:complete len:310 (-),score=90.26 TRINITY_DN2012_c0_g1_i1:23-952(-)